MRKCYFITSVFLLLIVTGCSKDVLRSYDHRIVGTWRIADINRFGIGARDNLPFEEEGRLTFTADGQVTYEMGGQVYRGSWDIIRHRNNEDEMRHALQLTAVDFNNQRVLSEYFNNMRFTGTNRFNASLEYGTRTYVYLFRR